MDPLEILTRATIGRISVVVRLAQRGYAATKKRDGSFTTKVAKYTKFKGKSIIIISKFFVAFVRSFENTCEGMRTKAPPGFRHTRPSTRFRINSSGYPDEFGRTNLDSRVRGNECAREGATSAR